MDPVQLREKLFYFVPGENQWQPSRALCAFDPLQPPNVVLEHFPIQKQKRAERLVLSRGRDAAVAGQMGKKLGDLGLRHFLGMPLPMIKNEPTDPIAVGPFRSEAEMFSPDDVPDLREQSGLVAGGGNRYVLGHAPQSGNISPATQR